MTVLGIVAGIILLSLIMILHELGHYLVARRLGFKVEQFSLFMGPVLFERVSRDGVRFNIKAVPIGASVSFAGEEAPIEGQSGVVADRSDPGLFYNRPRWARALTVAAGPFVNFLSAFLAFIVLFITGGVAVPIQSEVREGTHAAAAGIRPGDKIVAVDGRAIRTQVDLAMIDLVRKPDDQMEVAFRTEDNEERTVVFMPEVVDTRYQLGISYLSESDGRNVVQSVDPGSNSGAPVLFAGDQIISVDGVLFTDVEAIREILQASGGRPVSVEIIRNGDKLTVDSRPVKMDVYRQDGLLFTLTYAFSDAVSQAFHYPWSIVKSSVSGLSMMITGQLSARDNLTGPVGIVTMVTDVVANEGVAVAERLEQLLFLFAIISVAVGFTNLLPIPPLDGNHLLMLGIEGAIRRDLPEKLKQVIAYIGFALIIGLAAFVIYLDVARILAR
jgi:regulator of sigma E protease